MLKNELVYPTACERYLEERADRQRTKGSRDVVRVTLRGLQQKYPGLRCSEFTEKELVAYLRTQGWAPRTVLRRRGALVGFFRWAHKRALIVADPSAYLVDEVAPPARSVRAHTWLDDPEINAILDLPGSGPIGMRDRLVLGIPLYTGLRLAEFAGPPRAEPNRGLVWGRVRADTARVLGKGEKWATVGVNPRLAGWLTEWRTMYEEGLGRPVGLHDAVLCRLWSVGGAHLQAWCPREVRVWWGRGLGPAGIQHLVRQYGARIGYPELAPHDLRRSFAFSLKRAGVPIEDISQMLRHENIATTMLYLKEDKSALKGHWAKVGQGA